MGCCFPCCRPGPPPPGYGMGPPGYGRMGGPGFGPHGGYGGGYGYGGRF